MTSATITPGSIPKNNPNILSAAVNPVLPNNVTMRKHIPVSRMRLTINKPMNARIVLNTGVLTDGAGNGADAGENLIEIPNAMIQTSNENTIFREPCATPTMVGSATTTEIAISTDCTIFRPVCFRHINPYVKDNL